MNVVVIGRKKFVGPSCWEELTPKHFRQVLNWRIGLSGGPPGRWALLRLWYGIRYRHERLLSDEDRAWLISHLGFLDERPEVWLLPRLRVGFRSGWTRSYVGPGDGLEHLTFGEFMFAQSARDRYRDGQASTDLAELVASLYRPKAFFWQPSGEALRSLFDQRKLKAQSARMLLLDEPIQQGILLNFEGCLDRFPEQFPYLFKPAEETQDTGGTWLDVGLSLARQTGALGTFAQIERENLFLVLTTLDAIMKENADLKAQAEQWKQ